MLAWLHTAVAVKIRTHSELVAVVPVVADTCCPVGLAVELLELLTFVERTNVAVFAVVEFAAEAEAERYHRHSVVVVQRSGYQPDLLVAMMMTTVGHFGRQSCWIKVVAGS